MAVEVKNKFHGHTYRYPIHYRNMVLYIRTISADLGDAESRCRACSALALALDTLGLADKALVELKLVHSISEQAGDAILQSQACRALGTLYSKVGKLEESVQVLQRHFELLKSLAAKDKAAAAGSGSNISNDKHDHIKNKNKNEPIVKAKDLDLARVFVGVSKGNLLLGSYYYAIENDLSYLLEWKLTRAELPRPQHHQHKGNPSSVFHRRKPLFSSLQGQAL